VRAVNILLTRVGSQIKVPKYAYVEGMMSTWINKATHFVVTGGYSGLSPISPGTVGSIAATGVWILLARIGFVGGFISTVTAGVLLTLLGTECSRRYLAAHPDLDDPGHVVIDEWAGMTFALAAADIERPWTIVAALVVFRILDITKPWMIRRAEQLPGAWGVMFDDVIAGIASAGVVAILSVFV
jgi:phosphatidylglycerophosphatase A